MNNEIKFKKTATNVADKPITKGKLEFKTCMKRPYLNQSQLEQAQAKTDKEWKLKAGPELELEGLEKEKKNSNSII